MPLEVIPLSMSFPLEFKTGFFKVEPCLLKINSKSSQLIFELDQSKVAYFVDYETIKRVYYNPKMRHELAFQTLHDDYIGYMHKEDVQRGIVDFLKVEFGEKFKENNASV